MQFMSSARLHNTNGPGMEQLVFGTAAALCLEVASPPLPIRVREQNEPASLSLTQERLWFIDQINPGDVSSNISRAVRIKGDLKKDLLQQSLQAIIDRHESLRTTFATN